MDGERYRTMMCKLIFTMPKSSLCYSMPPLLTRGAEALQMRTLEANVWLNKRRGGGEYRIWQSHPADALTCFATADLPLFTYCRDTITTVFASHGLLLYRPFQLLAACHESDSVSCFWTQANHVIDSCLCRSRLDAPCTQPGC